MRKAVVIVLALALLVGVGSIGYVVGRGRNVSTVPTGSGVGTDGFSHENNEEPKALELPMFEVIDQKDLQMPTAKLGEPLQVGPVSLRVELADGFYWPFENEHKRAVYGFRVTIENKGNGALDLNPKTAYWITEEEQLQTRSIDPRVNWFVVAPGERRRIWIPDPKFLHDMGL